MSSTKNNLLRATDAKKLQSRSTAKSGSEGVGLPNTEQYDGRYGSDFQQNVRMEDTDDLLADNYELQLEDLGSSGSEYLTDDSDEDGAVGITGRTASVFGAPVPEPLTDRSKMGLTDRQQFDSLSQQSDDDDYMALRQISLLENEADDIDVDSEEERDIMAEIRAEITQKVREEMKSELDVYQHAKERLQQDDQPSQHDDLQDVEPKLKEAILKMRKLDKILVKKMKRERQVKRDRIMLQQRLRVELESIKTGTDKTVTVEEKRNTDRFLSLALPPSHNAGIFFHSGISEENPEADTPPPVTPVFQTQVPDETQAAGSARGGSRTASARSQDTSARSTMSGKIHSGASSVSGTSATTTDSKGNRVKRKKKKDFIKRNIQLASDASNTIAMTDDEKKRLEDLLVDIDTIPEIPEEEDSKSETPSLFQVAVPSGDGFLPSEPDKKHLQDIDNRLRHLMPPEDFQSIASVSPQSFSGRGSMLFTRTHMTSSISYVAESPQELGEYALQETKDQRDKNERLKIIEEELDSLTTAVEHEMQSPSLSETQLSELLDDCARTMSRATIETNSLAQSTGRSSARSNSSSLYDNPPHLSEDMLQQLLSDARRSMSGTDEHSHRNNRADMVLESFSEDSVHNSRSSYYSDSRPASHSSIGSRQHSQIKEPNSHMQGHSDRTMYNPDHYEDRRPFLPKIDPLGRLSTQRPCSRLNNEGVTGSRPTSRSLSNVYTVRNSFTQSTYREDEVESDDTISDQSYDDDTPTISPHPPSSGRTSAGRSHSRTVASANRDRGTED